MARCAAEGCGAKVDDGAPRCASCGANLAPPAAFLQTLGYVLLAISMIPFAIYSVVRDGGNFVPAIVGGVGFVVGLVMVISARTTNKLAPATTLEDKDPEESLG